MDGASLVSSRQKEEILETLHLRGRLARNKRLPLVFNTRGEARVGWRARVKAIVEEARSITPSLGTRRGTRGRPARGRPARGRLSRGSFAADQPDSLRASAEAAEAADSQERQEPASKDSSVERQSSPSHHQLLIKGTSSEQVGVGVERCEICNKIPRPACDTTIRCWGEDCPHKWLAGCYVERYMGIELNANFKTTSDHFLCRTCENKADTLRKAHEITLFINTKLKFGRDPLDGDALCEQIDRLWDVITRYHLYTDGQSSPAPKLMELPEILEGNNTSLYPFESIIRQKLKVPLDNTILDFAQQFVLDDLHFENYIRGILSSLAAKFIHESVSLFEQHQSVQAFHENAFGDRNAQRILQDIRLRMVKSDDFLARQESKSNEDAAWLQEAMQPLVKLNKNLEEIHKNIAKIAGRIGVILHSYAGEYEIVDPKFGDEFSFASHEEIDCFAGSSRHTLISVMFGVRHRGLDKGWRTCSRAKVVLQRLAQDEDSE